MYENFIGVINYCKEEKLVRFVGIIFFSVCRNFIFHSQNFLNVSNGR